MKYCHITQQRLSEIKKLLKININNYAILTQEEKDSANILTIVMKNPKFDMNLCSENVLNNLDYLKFNMFNNLPHVNAFKVKFEREADAKRLIQSNEFKIHHLRCISDELLNSSFFIAFLIYCKPNFFKSINKKMKKDASVNSIYINSLSVQWELLDDIYKKPATARHIMSRTFNNLSQIIKDLPEMKNELGTLESVAKYCSSGKIIINKQISMFEETFTLEVNEFSKLLLNMDKNIKINKTFIEAIKKTKYSIVMDKIELDSLSDKENYTILFNAQIRDFVLINNLNIKEKEPPRVKAKI